MLILAFETSGPTASVALMRDGVLLAEHTIHHTRTHSETVLPMAERLMREMELSTNELGALAVNIGPGSFTGVRIGTATANAMSSALDIPVVGIDSFTALYENAGIYKGCVCVLIDARNKQVYAAGFESDFKGIRRSGEPYAGDVEEFVEKVPESTLFIGDGAIAYRDIISSLSPTAVFVADGLSLSHASSLCKIANERLAQGIPRAFAEPLYLRPSQAERMWAKSREGRDGGE